MEGYDSIAMHTYNMAAAIAPPADMFGLPTTMPGGNGMLPLDALDHHSNYDAETYAGSEDAASLYGHTLHIPPPPTSAGIKQFAPGSYEDAYSDVLSNLEPNISNEANVVDSTSIEQDHTLLSFSTPTLTHAICDYGFRPVTIALDAQLHGMFFLAESALGNPSENDEPLPQAELTCYRRNLFQITGSITVPKGLRYIITDQGEQIPIVSQELTISATETVEGNAVKLICVPWKTPVTSAPSVEDNKEKEPPSIPLDLTSQDTDSDFITFPIAWKRLQFRIATANNGRRKELQQHFIVRLKLMATLASGACVNVCEVRSGAIVVRGRSPRNFQSRKDLPISGSTPSQRRRPTAVPSMPSRTPTGDSNPPTAGLVERQSPKNLEIPRTPFTFGDEYKLSPGIGFNMGSISPQPGVAFTAINSHFPVQNVGAVHVNYAKSTPDLTRSLSAPRISTQAPINLSLSEDDNNRVGGITSFTATQTATYIPRPRKTASASPVSNPSKRARTNRAHPRPPSFSLGPMSTADESADMLYEYFPLGLDDWMPPVDAVYRPHVVHHTNLPTDPKFMKNRGKRYFSEDQTV